MSLITTIFLCLGVLAVVYGLVLLWNAYQKVDENPEEHWLKPDERSSSRIHNFENMRYLMRAERSTANVSKGRGWLMLAIGIAIIVFAFI